MKIDVTRLPELDLEPSAYGVVSAAELPVLIAIGIVVAAVVFP